MKLAARSIVHFVAVCQTCTMHAGYFDVNQRGGCKVLIRIQSCHLFFVLPPLNLKFENSEAIFKDKGKKYRQTN